MILTQITLNVLHKEPSEINEFRAYVESREPQFRHRGALAYSYWADSHAVSHQGDRVVVMEDGKKYPWPMTEQVSAGVFQPAVATTSPVLAFDPNLFPIKLIEAMVDLEEITATHLEAMIDIEKAGKGRGGAIRALKKALADRG